MKILAIVLFVALLSVVGALHRLGRGRSNWNESVAGLRERLQAGRRTEASSHPLADLPSPVQRYFESVLGDPGEVGHRRIASVEIRHAGTFNMGRDDEKWVPFRSEQSVATDRPGFVWDARMRMSPVLTAFVRDSYVEGRGGLTAQIAGVFTVLDLEHTQELAEGQLMRYLAEAAWYPTALLAGRGVEWTAIDDQRAQVTLTDEDTSVELVFTFDEQGLIRSVFSEGRYREVDGQAVPTPWKGRFWDYERQHGVLIPMSGEVAWILPEGPKPYWRGRIEEISYEFED